MCLSGAMALFSVCFPLVKSHLTHTVNTLLKLLLADYYYQNHQIILSMLNLEIIENEWYKLMLG